MSTATRASVVRPLVHLPITSSFQNITLIGGLVRVKVRRIVVYINDYEGGATPTQSTFTCAILLSGIRITGHKTVSGDSTKHDIVFDVETEIGDEARDLQAHVAGLNIGNTNVQFSITLVPL